MEQPIKIEGMKIPEGIMAPMVTEVRRSQKSMKKKLVEGLRMSPYLRRPLTVLDSVLKRSEESGLKWPGSQLKRCNSMCSRPLITGWHLSSERMGRYSAIKLPSTHITIGSRKTRYFLCA